MAAATVLFHRSATPLSDRSAWPLLDLGRLVALMARSRSTLSAENLFLRKQLALFQERRVKTSRADDSTRCMVAALSRRFNWRDALVAVQGTHYPLAPQRIPTVLALEVEADRKTSLAKEAPRVDPENVS